MKYLLRRRFRNIILPVTATLTLALAHYAGHAGPDLFPYLGSTQAGTPKVIEIDLVGKTYTPHKVRANHGDEIRLCNKDPFIHAPFSYTKNNQFGNPKGVQIRPGQCATVLVVQNPTRVDQCVRLSDEFHAMEKGFVIVSPQSGAFSWTGAWQIVQETPKGTKFSGRIKIDRITDTIGVEGAEWEFWGTVEWDLHPRGAVYGSVVECRNVAFWLEYGGGLFGRYEGVLSDDGNIVEMKGTARSSTGGPEVRWSAGR